MILTLLMFFFLGQINQLHLMNHLTSSPVIYHSSFAKNICLNVETEQVMSPSKSYCAYFTICFFLIFIQVNQLHLMKPLTSTPMIDYSFTVNNNILNKVENDEVIILSMVVYMQMILNSFVFFYDSIAFNYICN